ncbi:MAG TPA: DUF805 domain-containing protein [Candidatus Methylomirabilis sp.]|nr:DUF805 domain-containing protein [Candidatus Methylomirabilis sp.]
MTFTEAIAAGFKNYVNFSGRALRSEYWYWCLFTGLAQIVLTVLDLRAGTSVLALLFTLVTLPPGIAVSVRRLHDIDKSGWFLLVGLIPIVGAIVLLVWCGREGSRGSNRFGSAPM